MFVKAHENSGTGIWSDVHDWKALLAQAADALESFVPGAATRSQGTQDSFYNFVDFFSARSAVENTSIVLAVATFVFLVMSWVPKWTGWSGRMSPFTRSPQAGPTKVSDSDFSYITNDDLRRHQQEGGDVSEASAHDDDGQERQTDVLVLKHKRQDYAIHFAAYSIAKGDLLVGQVRDAVAKKTNTSDARAIKLLYKGKNLKDDSRTCKAEGLRNGSELLCTIADTSSGSTSDGEDDGDELPAEGSDSVVDSEGIRRKRNRGKKTKRRNKREAAIGDDFGSLGVPLSQASPRNPSPKPPPKPVTPNDKLDAAQAKMMSYLPECEKFQTDPPADPAKREFDHKRLSETILAQVLLQLDDVDPGSDDVVRARRRALVKEAQKILADLDAVMKR